MPLATATLTDLGGGQYEGEVNHNTAGGAIFASRGTLAEVLHWLTLESADGGGLYWPNWPN